MKESEITEVFYQIARLLEKQAKSSKRNVDPFSGQNKCLFLLDKAEKMSQQRLANILEIRATSLSEVLAKLEHKGYILREPSSTDKRTYDCLLYTSTIHFKPIAMSLISNTGKTCIRISMFPEQIKP